VRSFPWCHFWYLSHRDRLSLRTENHAVAFARDGKTFALAGPENTVKLYDLAIGRELFTLSGHRKPVRCVAFSADGKLLASASEDAQVAIWDVVSGKKRGEASTLPVVDPVAQLTFSADGKIIAAQCVAPYRGRWTVVTGEWAAGQLRALKSLVGTPRLSSNGSELVSHKSDGSFELIDMAQPEKRRAFPKSKAAGVVTCEAFSADGRLFATGSSDAFMFGLGWMLTQMASVSPRAAQMMPNFKGEVTLWDTTTAKPKHRLAGHAGLVSCVAFSPCAHRLASGSLGTAEISFRNELPAHRPGQLKLWDTESGEEVASVEHRDGLWSIAFHPDGSMGAFGTGGLGEVHVFDTASGQVKTIFRGHTAPVFALAFSHDGRTLASSSEDGTVKRWDIAMPAEPQRLQARALSTSLAFTPDGQSLLFEETGGARLVHLDTGKSQRFAEGLAVSSVRLSADGKAVIMAGSQVWSFGVVTVWDMLSGKSHRSIRAGSFLHPSISLAVSPDGRTLATAANNSEEIKLWDLATGKEAAVLPGQWDALATALAFDPAGRLLAVGGLDGSVTLWNAASGKRYVHLPRSGGSVDPFQLVPLRVNAVAFSPDGKTLAVGHGFPLDIVPGAHVRSEVRLWDVDAGKVLLTLKGHQGSIGGLAFSPDGLVLATASADKTVRLWDAATGQNLATFQGAARGLTAVAFSPDNRRLAALDGDGTIFIWHAATPKEVAARTLPAKRVERKGRER
jgi:WD40 repeat protein